MLNTGTIQSGKNYFSIQNLSFGLPAILIIIISIVLYANTWQNEFALDDEVVIIKNQYVHSGLAGIPDILTHDAFDSYFKQFQTTNHLAGGRYRPLSIITFAIEQQFFGVLNPGQTDSLYNFGVLTTTPEHYEKEFVQQMHIRHLVNVALYALACLVLLYLLNYVIFRGNPLAAFFAALLFAIHPLHTEVVANVKSRDEILSLIFICSTLIFVVKHQELKKWWYLLLSILSFFLAFLSKEYAITLVVLIPLALYIYQKETIRKCLIYTIPFILVTGLYIFIRFQIIGNTSTTMPIKDIQVNPYAYASPEQKLATEIATPLNYLRLLIFPHPLSADYSYNQIPYKEFSHPLVWLSIIIHLAIIAGIIYFTYRRHSLAFALAFYFFNLVLISNLVIEIGATMGERLIFHASIGFVIAVVWLINWVYERIRQEKLKQFFVTSIMLLLVLISGYKVIARNKDWKNNETLYFKDIEVSPNSFLVNNNVGSLLINRSDFENDKNKRREDLQRGIGMLTKVLELQNDYLLGYFNRAIGYYKLGYPDSAIYNLEIIRGGYPQYPQLPQMYYNVAGLYVYGKYYSRAADVMKILLQMNPNDLQAQQALHSFDSMAKVGQGN